MDMTRELRASEFRWKYALEGAGDGVWDSDLRTGEVVFSRRWREMLGYRQEEIPNHRSSWEKLLHPDDKEKVMQNLAAYLRGKSPAYSAEFRMRCKDGGWRWILARGTVVLRDEKGMPLRMIGTHSDISQRKEAEQREAERVRSLEETRTALHHAQKLEAVGKLTGGVAHDFNNVLQIIASNLHLLQRYLTGDAQANKRLESAMGAVERGAKLSTQLLTFARRQPLQPVVIDLRALIDNMNDLLRQAMGAAIDIAVVADNDLWKTKVDPDQLSNVVLNLALNSRDAMKEAGRLTIRMCNKVIAEGDALLPDLDKGEYVLIEISDTGSGMPPDVIEHAFEPFYTTKRQGEGTGLGLSTAYGFAKQSGGHIRIESEVGVGTTLRIYLPRSLESETVKTEDAGVAADGGSEAILVVEDDPEVRLAAVEMLSELGYRAVEAGSGDEALDVLRGGSPVDLIFTDVVMPGSVRGTKLAEKAHQIRPGVPILFTSGYTQNEIMKNGMLDPDVPLIGKPYKKEQLAHKLRELLPARQAAS
jgi:PAS domain S-box-containing protein